MARVRQRFSWFLAELSVAALALCGGASATAASVEYPGLQHIIVQVSVNGEVVDEDVVLVRDESGTFFVPPDMLADWRLGLGGARYVTVDKQSYQALEGDGLRVAFDPESQTLKIEAASSLFEASTIAVTRLDIHSAGESGHGAYLNYDLLAEYSGDSLSLNTALEGVVFMPKGIGEFTVVGHLGEHGSRFTRLDSRWTIDSPTSMTSLRIGDSIMRGGVGGGPLRFGGIQWARDFSVAPTFITIPLPTLTGSAAIPSVVDVLVNNRLQAQRDVQPGPFEFTNLPVLTGAGEVQLVVRDALGRESVTTQRYYAASHMLRRGLHDFSYELGFLRDDYGFRSNDYGALAGAATHRYGLTDTLTGEVHIEATEKTQVAGAAASLALPGLGLIDGAAAMSRSRDRIGALFGLGFERRSIGLSFGARVEIASEGYRNLGLPDFRQAPRKTARAFVGLPLAFGSVGLSYLLRDERDDRPDTEVLGASASARLGSFGSLHLSAQRFFGEENETVLGLVLSTPLGPRTSAGASMEMRDGGVQASAAIQRSPPVGEGWGYHASVSHGAFDRASGRLGYQGGFGAYEAELTWTERGSGVRASVSGAVGFVAGGGGFTSRQLTQSFATVKVGNVKGVEVYADNQLVARTNGSGFAVVPRLRPYESNVLRIEATDLPWDATVTGGEMEVRPRARSGVALDFGVQQSHVALVRMVREDGAAVPAGAMVQIEGNPEEFVAAPGGEAYLTGLEPKNRVRASWTGGTCAFDLPFEASDDPQPRLGPFTCR